jgi:hypothetical protein
MDKTDAKLKALEKQIKATYTKAYQEMKKEASDILAKIELNPDMPLAQKMALMTKYDRLNNLSNQLANTAYNANSTAQKMINNEMVNIYDINYNGDAERLGFGLVDHTAIKKILKQEENPFNMISSLRDKEGIRNQMKGQLLQGLLKGESINKIARRLKDVSEKSLKDSIRIARTETTRVQNSAKMDIGKHGQELGFEMWKRWVATTDGRVREDHLAMNGVEVPQDEPFVLPDGSKMMFPADISLGADVSQVVNCRCTMIEFMKEKPVEEEAYVVESEEIYKDFNSEREASDFFRGEWSPTWTTSSAQEDSMFGEWKSQITEQQEKSFYKYTKHSSPINNALRNGTLEDNPDIKGRIDDMTSAIEQFDLKEGIRVTRFSNDELISGLDEYEGAIVSDDAFISTTVRTGQNYVDIESFGNDIEYEINVPAGKGIGAYLAPISSYYDEQEFLLQRGTSFIVDKVEKDGSGKVKKVFMTVLKK